MQRQSDREEAISEQTRASRRRGRGMALLAAALLALLLSAAPAAATYDPIGSGTTKLALDPGFAAILRSHGVKLVARAPVKISGRTISFPVSGGRLDPVAVRGAVDHEGALVFQAGPRRLPLKSLQLKTTQQHSPLSAKFGGGQLKLAASAKLSTKRQGFGLDAKVSAIELSAKVATRLDKKLGLRGVFAAGQPFGSALTNAQPATVAIKQAGKANLELAPEFLAKLGSLFVALNPIFPAEHLAAPFTLPIAGGKLAPDAASGTLTSSGTLELIQNGGGQVFMRDLTPNFDAHLVSTEFQFIYSRTNLGPISEGPLFDLLSGAVASEPNKRTITVSGALLALQAATAQGLNEAFAKPQGKSDIFKTGEALGSISFTAQAE
jgi:hypothetical protein